MKKRSPIHILLLFVLLSGLLISQTRLFLDYSALQVQLLEDETRVTVCSVFKSLHKNNENGIDVIDCSHSQAGKFELFLANTNPRLQSVLENQFKSVDFPSSYDIEVKVGNQQASVNFDFPSGFELLREQKPQELILSATLFVLFVLIFLKPINSQFSQFGMKNQNGSSVCRIGLFQFDFRNQTLSYAGRVRRMTERESQILWHLYQQKNQLVRRDELLIELWGESDYFKARSMDVFIAKMRKYLSDDPRVSIENVRGVGFVLNVPETSGII